MAMTANRGVIRIGGSYFAQTRDAREVALYAVAAYRDL
jgi:hypothetical protein